MGWRVGVVHTTKVTYRGTARASYNECRMTPPTMARQTTLATSVRTGSNVPIWSYRDYFGTTVSSFDIQEPHEELLVQASATVQTSAAPPAPVPLPWTELRERAAESYVLEYLAETQRTTMDDDVMAAVAGRVAGADPAEAASEIITWLREKVSYVAGLDRGADQRAGGLGRRPGRVPGHGPHQRGPAAGRGPARPVRLGLPAPRPQGRTGRGGGRAELTPGPSTGPASGWPATRPTWPRWASGTWSSAGAATTADVSPLKGIYSGAPSVAMEVKVEITRLA